jgi:site-specific DNA-methyltransferase (adenine-specific)
MQYLVRLVTPKWWTVLDPFMWSWSTGKACRLEWFDFIGIEREEEYCKIARQRIASVKLNLFS